MKKERKHIRWRNWDYSYAGAYFVTICTKQKEPFFGTIKKDLSAMGNEMEFPYPVLDSYLNPSLIAETAWKFWVEIPHHYPFVKIDAFIIMPDHIHGILLLEKSSNDLPDMHRFGPQKNNLPDVIRTYKSAVKRWTNKQEIPFAWQRRYHDRVIRDQNEMKRIQTYIWNNPSRRVTL